MAHVSKIDKFIVERAPWKLAKERQTSEEAQAKLDETLYTAAESAAVGVRIDVSGDAGVGGEDLGAARDGHDDSAM